MLRRILLNLIANAVRYTRTGGVLIAVRPRAGRLAIDVIDSGVGIPAEERQRVFEEFHRISRPADPPDAQGGLGLGLSIVRRLVDALGHDIELHSLVGKGTRFRLWADAAPGESPSRAEECASPPGLGQGLAAAKVLIIENDPAVLAAMIELMAQWGCSLRPARTLAEARAAVSDADWIPDLVIADQHLDRGDIGTQSVAWLRSFCGVDIPAIIATADPGDETIAAAAAVGAHLLQKPVKPAQLRALATHLVATGLSVSNSA